MKYKVFVEMEWYDLKKPPIFGMSGNMPPGLTWTELEYILTPFCDKLLETDSPKDTPECYTDSSDKEPQEGTIVYNNCTVIINQCPEK